MSERDPNRFDSGFQLERAEAAEARCAELEAHAEKYHRDFSDVVEAKFAAEAERDRMEKALREIAKDYLESEGKCGADPTFMIESYLDRVALSEGTRPFDDERPPLPENRRDEGMRIFRSSTGAPNDLPRRYRKQRDELVRRRLQDEDHMRAEARCAELERERDQQERFKHRANERADRMEKALRAYEADHSGNDNPEPCPCPLCVEARAALSEGTKE